MPHHSIARKSTTTARQTVLLALCGAGAIIVGILIALVGFQNAEQSVARRLEVAYRAANQILLGDERLTMSANMAVATGDEAWIERYEANVSLIENAIRRAHELAPLSAAKEFDAKTRASHDRLVELESAVFQAVRAGETATARRLLNSGLYAHHRRVLDEGTRVFVNSMIAAERNRLDTIEGRIWFAIPLALLISVACALLLWRRLNASLWRSEQAFVQAEDTIGDLAWKNALAAETLTAQKVQLDTALDNMGRGLSMFDAQARLIVCNSFYRQIYDLPEELVQPGTPLADIIRYHVKRESCQDSKVNIENERKWIEDHTAALARGKSFSHTQHLKSGRTVLVTNQPLPHGGWVDVQEDITEKLRFEAKIEHMAHHDGLTDLPNRVLLGERMKWALARVRRGERLAFHLLDLDGFKAINDAFGHPIGDELLKAVAERLRGILRETDTIARMGGDEFAIVQVGTENDEVVTSLARRLIDVISKPYEIRGQHMSVGASIGIALAPADGDTADQLIKNADLALYQAKAQGRGTYCSYDKELSVSIQPRQSLEADLRRALAAGEFDLHYQPIVNLETYQIVGVEALMRWRHPERGMILPGEFIPVAEKSGLIIPLGEWAIRQACTQASAWPDHIKVAVNLSPLQFKGRGLLKVVASALAASGLPASRLELEITETVLLGHTEANVGTLHKLRDLGVRIELDDFGTRYSSLSYLQKFPFDKIKIDQCFIKKLTFEDNSLKIVRAAVMLARSLGLKTTAEGVETKEQLDAVRFEGCDEAQGYFFGRPQPARDIEHLFLPSSNARPSSKNPQASLKRRKVSQ